MKKLLKPQQPIGFSDHEPELVRVRTFLQNKQVASKLARFLPKSSTSVPDVVTTPYPNSLLSLLPEQHKYSFLGVFTELLLAKCLSDISMIATLFSELSWKHLKIQQCVNSVEEKLKDKGSIDYISSVIETSRQLRIKFGRNEPAYDREVRDREIKIAGHPDIISGSHIFEVKYTGKLKIEWKNFLLQLFCYGAIAPDATRLSLVLPNQQTIISWSVREWTGRNKFRDLLTKEANQLKVLSSEDIMTTQLAFQMFRIGTHRNRPNNMKLSTMFNNNHLNRWQQGIPYQIFLRGNCCTKGEFIKDDELALISQGILNQNIKIFIHAPYTINLCKPPGTEDDYFTETLIYQLKVGVLCGFKGVVIHTGKLCKGSDNSMDAFYQNVLKVLPYASEYCPLLIETPARQGTEQLNDPSELVNFVRQFDGNPKIGICVDSCHVFAAGYTPVEYIGHLISMDALNLLKLVHFNDSKEPLGSCKDRHAIPGQGYIGLEQLLEFASICQEHNIPMVHE